MARTEGWLATGRDTLSGLSRSLSWLGLQWFFSIAAEHYNLPHYLLTIIVSLLAVWIIIRFASSLIREPSVSKGVSIIVWTVTALNIVGLLGPTIDLLDGLALNAGDLRISILTLIKGVIALGALGVGGGVGLGLQKLVSNLVSGLLILIDKSVKPGDVIEVTGTYGQVKSLGGRYASVITTDGVEHLIPNEDLISQRVSNWTHSSNEVRLKLPVGISYDSDVRKAMKLIAEAASETDRILTNPAPNVLAIEFGDSSVNLELRFWINDPMNGIANVKSVALLLIWDKFHENGIEIPYPQRDLHIKSSGPLKVVP